MGKVIDAFGRTVTITPNKDGTTTYFVTDGAELAMSITHDSSRPLELVMATINSMAPGNYQPPPVESSPTADVFGAVTAAIKALGPKLGVTPAEIDAAFAAVKPVDAGVADAVADIQPLLDAP